MNQIQKIVLFKAALSQNEFTTNLEKEKDLERFRIEKNSNEKH